MSRIAPIARILLGLGFTLFGLNYFVPFLPQPNVTPPPEALQFLGAFAASGFLTLIKVVEVGAGLALLANRFVGLSLALLAPVLVGIVGFHALLMPSGIAVPLALLALELALAWSYRRAFVPMLRAQLTPDLVLPAGAGARFADTTVDGPHRA